MMKTETLAPIPFFKRNWVKNVLWIIVAFIIYLVMRPIMQGDVARGQAPQIEAVSLSGKAINLAEIQQPALIHIWATWCPICQMTRDGVEALAKDYPVISIATQSDTEELLKYVAEHQMNPDHIINDKDGKLMQAFGARGVPADFIVDAQGQIQFVEIGYSTSLGLRLRLWWLSL